MAIDRNKLNFYSGDMIDKVVAPVVQRSITNDGDTGGSTGWQTAKIVQQTYANPYGKRCFVRGRWSIDGGTTWYTFNSRKKFNFTMHFTGSGAPPDNVGSGLQAAISIGVNDNNVIIRTANGDHGTVTIDVATSAQSYSPVPHTFLVEYELYERL